MKLISVVVLILPFFLNAQTSSSVQRNTLENTEITVQQKELVEDKVNPSEDEIIEVETVNEITTYLISNNEVRKALFFNVSKRNEITALPGFFELGISSEEKPMRVKIDVDYAEEYLDTYFRTNVLSEQ
jgi:uncharacterized membrane protein YvbJ